MNPQRSCGRQPHAYVAMTYEWLSPGPFSLFAMPSPLVSLTRSCLHIFGGWLSPVFRSILQSHPEMQFYNFISRSLAS